MPDIHRCANIFQTKNRGKGVITNETEWSFTWTTTPSNKDAKPETKIYYISYFLWNKDYE